MSTPPTPFASAIEEFILHVQSKEDKSSVFYKEVLVRINAGTFRRDLSDPSRIWAEQLAACVDDLQRQNRENSVGRKAIEKLGPIVSGFNQYVDACDVLVQAGPAAAMLLYGGARLVLQLMQKVHDCYATVVEILEDIHFYIQCFGLFSTSYDASEVVREHLVKSYKAIIEFWVKASRLLSSKLSRALFSRRSQLSREWQNDRQKLERCHKRVMCIAQAAEVDMRQKRDEQNEAKRREKERRETMQRVVSWIKACEDDDKLDFRATIRKNGATRHGKSGDWVLANPSYQAWLSADKSATIWLRGLPGTGKSVLASKLLQNLQAQERNGTPLKTASYFFFFNDPVRRKAITALRSIAIQLLAFYSSVPDAVLRIYDEDASRHVAKLEDINTAIKVVEALAKHVSRVHIIVDGLDECEERQTLLDILKRLSCAPTYGIVKWFFASRLEKDLQASLGSHISTCIDVSVDNTRDDIRAFMSERLRGKLGIDCDNCVNKWISKSQGNFLWADLTMRIMESEGLTCEAEVEEALARFPVGLQGCYERSLQHLVRSRTKTEVELARKVFTLVAGAERPLQLSETEQALVALRNTREAAGVGDYDERWKPRPGVIEGLCSALIVFEQAETDVEYDPLLKFVHKSVQDFFFQDAAGLEVSEDVRSFFLTSNDANLLLGEACLRYLSFARYKRPQDMQGMLTQKAHAFLRHAATFWHYYLAFIPPERELAERVLRFINSPCFWNCVAVQAHTAPHLFARLYQSRGAMFHLQASGIRESEDPNKVYYASPLPLWLDQSSCGPGGRSVVEAFQEFIRQWHPVLNSVPSAIGQCVMSYDWNTSFPNRRRWTSDRLTACELPHLPPLDQAPAPFTNVSIVDVRLENKSSEGLYAVSVHESKDSKRMRTGKTEATKHWNIKDNKVTESAGAETALDLQEELQRLTIASQAPDISIQPKDLVVEVHDAEETSKSTSTQKHFPPANYASDPWILRHHCSAICRANGVTIAAAFCIIDPSRSKPCEDRPGDTSDLDSDEELDEIDESDESDDDDDDDDDEDSDDSSSAHDSSYDSGVGFESTSDESSNRCMIIASATKQPIYSFWTSTKPLEETHCAISPHRNVAIWSQSTSEAFIVDLAADTLTPINVHLPEPRHMATLTTPMATWKEFHFSEQDDDVYYLSYTANQTPFGIEQSLTVTPLTISRHNATEPNLDRTGQACSITHASAGALRSPSLLTSWTSEYLILALPQLSCDPKILRLKLADLKDTHPHEPQFETLQDPIYFPASTPLRHPKLYFFDHSSSEGDEEKQKLVLTLDSQPALDGKSMLHPPLIMQWTFHGKAAWRAWDERADRESGQYKSMFDVCSRLRGTFVDAKQSFRVPIRSGLDWTRRAFVSCA